MGTWGSGNLDSDGALDELGTRSDALAKQLWERVQKKESWEADEWDHDALFVDFETMFALEAGGVFSGYSLPAPAEVDTARDTWLAGWDGYIEGLAPKPEYKAERRKVIEKTFLTFRAICEKYQRA